MIRALIKLAKKLVLGYKADSESYISHLRKRGCQIGEYTHIWDPMRSLIDETRPDLIEIGNNVCITRGVVILTHGYDWSVLQGKYGEVIGSSGKVTIGDNVFIGINTVILKGTKIGDNVIIGAGSLVNKEIPSNCVAAGNPAKVIMSLDEYYEKRKKESVEEAKELAITYYQKYKRRPPISLFREFFWLFLERDENSLRKHGFHQVLELGGNYGMSKAKFMNSTPNYNGFDDFLTHCGIPSGAAD